MKYFVLSKPTSVVDMYRRLLPWPTSMENRFRPYFLGLHQWRTCLDRFLGTDIVGEKMSKLLGSEMQSIGLSGLTHTNQHTSISLYVSIQAHPIKCPYKVHRHRGLKFT